MRWCNKFFIVSLIFVLFSCASKEENEKGNRMAFIQGKMEVEARVLALGVFHQEILSNGVLLAQKKARLKFSVFGEIESVFVKNGDHVKLGDTLVKLNDRKERLQLEKANNQLFSSEIDLNDQLLLYRQDGKAPTREVMNTVKQRSGYNAALLAIEDAEFQLSKTVITAPFSGVISDLQAKPDNNTSDYSYIANLMDDKTLEVVFGVLESDIQFIEKGCEIKCVPYAHPDKSFVGTISEINPSVDANGLIQVKAIVQNPNRELLNGMNVDVFVLKNIDNQLFVPKKAVLNRQNRKVVFRLHNDSVVEWVYVKTGLENSKSIIISEGLNPNDTIVVDKNFNLGHKVVVTASIVE